MVSRRFLRPVVSVFALLGFLSAGRADEGMWLFTNPPGKLLKEKYGFEPTKEWLEHVQKSSIRFSSGGSASCASSQRNWTRQARSESAA